MKNLLIHQVKSFVQKNTLFAKGNLVIVGVSGGADSVFLLSILHQLQHELGISLIAAHFNHQLRKEAGKDEKFVKALANNLHIPYVTDTWRGTKKNLKGSIEDLARSKRLAFFKKISERFKTNIVALAHTQDDLAETVLMRLIRGTGLKGIRSILPQRKINHLNIVRPLLNISKKEILAYLKSQKITFREDSTNQTTIFFRNKIRLELLPLLQKEYNPNIVENLVHLARNTNIDYDFIETQARNIYKKILLSSKLQQRRLNLKRFNQIHSALQHMLISFIIEDLKKDSYQLETRHYEEIDKLLDIKTPVGTIIHLPHNIFVKKLSTTLNFELHNKRN